MFSFHERNRCNDGNRVGNNLKKAAIVKSDCIFVHPGIVNGIKTITQPHIVPKAKIKMRCWFKIGSEADIYCKSQILCVLSLKCNDLDQWFIWAWNEKGSFKTPELPDWGESFQNLKNLNISEPIIDNPPELGSKIGILITHYCVR